VESTESKLDRLREILRGLGASRWRSRRRGLDVRPEGGGDTLGRENVLASWRQPQLPEADARQAQELAEMIASSSCGSIRRVQRSRLPRKPDEPVLILQERLV
jgi:hypothetical protein